jgi:hypothetical protein
MAKSLGVSGQPSVERHGNVTVFWDQSPSASDERVVETLLSRAYALEHPVRTGTTTSAKMRGRLDLEHGRVGDIAIGMQRVSVDYRNPNIHYTSCAVGICSSPTTHDATYFTAHGPVYVLYGPRDQVADIRFISSYRSREAIGVGIRIPLGRCHRVANSVCAHFWRGYRLMVDNAGDLLWRHQYGKLLVALFVRGGVVTSIEFFNDRYYQR